MDTTGRTPKRIWFKSFAHYAFWFVLWGGLFWLLQPTYPDEMAHAGFWTAKGVQALLGMGVGAISAVVFTLLQNAINQSRNKWVSWLFAIGTWGTFNITPALLTGRL